MSTNGYDDIIHLPHHVSAAHPQMSLYDRAAQFAPFKALSGYEDDMEETARLTDARIELDESRVEQLDARLRLLAEHVTESPEVSVTVFRADERKEGGAYRTESGRVKKLDAVAGVLVMRDGRRYPFSDLYAIEGELFAPLTQ